MKEKAKGLNGLVLSGGKSSRMGREKSLLEFHGMPQKEYAFQLLEQCCDKVYTSISVEADPYDYKNPIVDQFSFGGPINGILSALKFQPNIGWLTFPVDMPLVNESILKMLIQHRDEHKVATCFCHVTDGELEPLLTIWEPHSQTRMMEFCKSGNSSPYEFLKNSEVHKINFKDERLLTSVNTQADIAAFHSNRAKT